MAHFAELDKDGIVLRVIVVANEVIASGGGEDEKLGLDFLEKLYGHRNWKQTSYNTQSGTHTKSKTHLRKNFAGIGYKYDISRDAFIPPKVQYNSWVLDENTCNWKAPKPYPKDGKEYKWEEATVSWKEIIV